MEVGVFAVLEGVGVEVEDFVVFNKSFGRTIYRVDLVAGGSRKKGSPVDCDPGERTA